MPSKKRFICAIPRSTPRTTKIQYSRQFHNETRDNSTAFGVRSVPRTLRKPQLSVRFVNSRL